MTSAVDVSQKAGLPWAGYACAAAGATLFASKGIIIKLAYAEGVAAETLLALRMAFSLPFYLVIGVLAFHQIRAQGGAMPSRSIVLKSIALGGIGFWLSSYLDFEGLQYISASFGRLILFTYPLFVTLFGALLFRQPIRRRALVAFAAAYCGLALIFLHNFEAAGTDVLRGSLFVMGAAIVFAFYQLGANRVLQHINSGLFTCIAMTASALAAIAQFASMRPLGELMVTGRLLWLSLLIAFGATVLPTFLMNASLKRISAQANSTIGTVSPVATMVLAALFLGETATPSEMAGAALVMVGIGWFTFGGRAGRRA